MATISLHSYTKQLDILTRMDKILHDLKPGYYWYTMQGDPPAVIHIYENGGASLMGTDFRLEAQGVADMIAQGERFFWIEPPAL